MLSHLRKPIDATRFVRRMSGTPLSTRDPSGFKSLEETYAGMTSNIKVTGLEEIVDVGCVASLFMAVSGGCAGLSSDCGRPLHSYHAHSRI
jgi:hypothetical protein